MHRDPTTHTVSIDTPHTPHRTSHTPPTHPTHHYTPHTLPYTPRTLVGLYGVIRDRIAPPGKTATMLDRVIAGSGAGGTAALLCNPIEVRAYTLTLYP